MGNKKEKLRDIKKFALKSFNTRVLDEISSFLGIRFDRKNDAIEMRQSMCLKNILRISDIYRIET